MKKIYLFATAVLSLAACDNTEDITGPDNITESTQVALGISATIGESVVSRAIDTEWAAGDEIGITATVGDLETTGYRPHINLKYMTTDGGSHFEGEKIFFYNNLTLTAYYPYSGTEGTLAGKLTTDTRAEKQNTEEQAKFDYLYASKTGIKVADAENVDLQFGHRMSKLTFTFVNASSDNNNPMDVSKMASYSIEGLKMVGSFNTLTGECCADDDAERDTLSIDVKGKVTEKKALPSLLVFPQVPEIEDTTTQDDGSEKTETIQKARLHMYIDEAKDGATEHLQHYYCTLSFGDNKIKPGYHYSFTVYVTKVGMIMGEMKIVGWDEITNTIAATIDGDIDLPDDEVATTH